MKKKFSNNSVGKMLTGNIGIISVLLLIGIILSFVSPVFLTPDNIISVLRQVSNNMYLALGMTLIIILGGIDLSVASIVAMCGTLTVGFMVNQGMPMGLAVALWFILELWISVFFVRVIQCRICSDDCCTDTNHEKLCRGAKK